MLSFTFIINILFSFVIHVLAVETSRIIRGVNCRKGEYYNYPAENCISCHVPCDNAIMKKSQDDCNNFCPDFAKSLEQTSEVEKPSVQLDMSWVAAPVVGGFLTLTFVIAVVIYCRKFRSTRKRNVEVSVNELELQTLDPQHGRDGPASLDGRQLVSVQHNPENTNYPPKLNSAPYIPPSRTLYHFPQSKSLPNDSHYFHHPNEFFKSDSQHFHCSISNEQHNDPVRGPIPYTDEQDDGMIKEETDTTELKTVVEPQVAQNGTNLGMLSIESERLQNDNSFISELHCSMCESLTSRRLLEEQESLVRAEVSSIPQVSCNRNIPSVLEHNDCLPNFVGVPRNTFHNVAMEHSVCAHLASPDMEYFRTPPPTSKSIPVIVEHPEGDPDNLEWQAQQHRAAQDKISLQQSIIGINMYNEKDFSMDNPKHFLFNM